MKQARPDVTYATIEADTMMEKEPWRYNGYLKRLLERVEVGGLVPINMHVFSGLEEGVQALQFLQRANNIGKVVLSEPSRMLCGPASRALLSGGTGALGVICAQFLAEEGAKALCLLSRGGQVPAEVQERWKWLQNAAVEVSICRCDVSQESSVASFAESAFAKGGKFASLFHLAGGLADGMLPNLSREMFERSYGPKVNGLHFLRRNLSFEPGAPFVLFSSTSSLFGSPGQGNYAAANAVLDSMAPYWSAQGDVRAVAVQWGPWAEAGMAAVKGTVARAKAGGIGALSIAQGMTILASVLGTSAKAPRISESLVGAAHVRWRKFLRAAFDAGAPRFLDGLAAEAQRLAAAAGEASESSSSSMFAALPPEERALAVRDAVRRLARDVVGDNDLAGDSALLESGMDSLSGVEFRNRLQAEFGGVRIPNSAVFDYPTADLLASFVDRQLGAAADKAIKPIEATPSSSSSGPRLLEGLNERRSGRPLFLVPGAGMQAGGFMALAAILPVPCFGVSWPRTTPRSQWPSSLQELAALLLVEVKSVQEAGPYHLAGHSFGASLVLEMARQLEGLGENVALVALLDPRNLPPVQSDVGAILENSGLAQTLAMLSQTVPSSEAPKYIAQLEALSSVEPSGHADSIRSGLGAAALAALEHVHETFTWYAGLLSSSPGPDAPLQRTDRLLLLKGAETWRRASDANAAQDIVRDVQSAVFQADSVVALRLSEWVPKTTAIRVPGGHFAMLHDPHVATVALRLCHALVEAGAAPEESGDEHS